jgi:hypothetical protein
VNVTKEP